MDRAWKYVAFRGQQGDDKIELDKMRKPQIVSMHRDLEAVKQFLIKQNNEEQLNIELLCVVGSEFEATLG